MPNQVIPAFDFSDAEALSVDERISVSVERARATIAEFGLAQFHDAPMIPPGASEEEIALLERQLGVALPAEYKRFLGSYRYLLLDDGFSIGGFDFEGVHYSEAPWVSDEHNAPTEYLVFGAYCAYADGDQLMFDLSTTDQPVVAYLHEHGPLFEAYAPSFSLALWRLVAEEAAGARRTP